MGAAPRLTHGVIQPQTFRAAAPFLQSNPRSDSTYKTAAPKASDLAHLDSGQGNRARPDIAHPGSGACLKHDEVPRGLQIKR
jgi:hypothetical protein